ncbi:hypothetical protein HPB52_007238 [Rhipicephalus sanguineus]|uniref:C2H2-type domain-containing protein n=1 Tax=Rhipicephalus sanguineus TaxID=34632 RepID=A0A9D4SVV7_RHISA|nr:hypothetical protein HPB52_007238 [Rhipicephalus sanguineus]
METCVLIPPEFSLVLSTTEDSSKLDSDEDEATSKTHPYDMKVRLWANQAIPVGKIFSPAEGSVRLDRLEVYSLLDDNDVRHSLGCYDEIREVEERQVRHCNWVRFVRIAKRLSRTSPQQRQAPVLYRVLRPVQPNTELVAFFNDSAEEVHHIITTSTPKAAVGLERRLFQRTLQDFPLDLSQNLLSPSTSTSASSASSSSCRASSSTSSSSSGILRTPASISCTSTCSSSSPSTSEANNENIQEKPHKCPVCAKSFPTPGDLKTHAYVHSGSWPFRCHLCDRGFSKHTNLRNHLFLHTGDRPHTCDVCHKTFALACNLRAHMKTHQEGCPHVQCQRCRAEFPVSSRLVVNGLCQQCTHQPTLLPPPLTVAHQQDFSIRRLVSP